MRRFIPPLFLLSLGLFLFVWKQIDGNPWVTLIVGIAGLIWWGVMTWRDDERDRGD